MLSPRVLVCVVVGKLLLVLLVAKFGKVFRYAAELRCVGFAVFTHGPLQFGAEKNVGTCLRARSYHRPKFDVGATTKSPADNLTNLFRVWTLGSHTPRAKVSPLHSQNAQVLCSHP